MLEAVSAAMKAVHATEKRKATVKGPGGLAAGGAWIARRQHEMVQPRTPPAAPVDDLVDAKIPAIPKTSDEFMRQKGQDRETLRSHVRNGLVGRRVPTERRKTRKS